MLEAGQGKRTLGDTGKRPVFGLLRHSDKVSVAAVRDCSGGTVSYLHMGLKAVWLLQALPRVRGELRCIWRGEFRCIWQWCL